jgi:hypothetical protein
MGESIMAGNRHGPVLIEDKALDESLPLYGWIYPINASSCIMYE